MEAYVRQAHLLRTRLDRPEKADELMNQLRQATPGSPPALIARARYFRETGRPAEAKADAERAVSLADDSAEVRYEAARVELALGCEDVAANHLAAGLKHHPDHLPSIRLLAELRKRNPKTSAGQEIRKLVLRTLETLEDNPRRTADVLDLLIDVNELAEARKLLAGPQNNWLPGSIRDFLEARVLMAENDFVRARELLERCRAQLAPIRSLARVNYLLLGICQRKLGNPEQAAMSFRTALDLSPAWVPAQLELAAAELKRGQFDEALNLYRKLMLEVPEARVVVVRLAMQRVLKKSADHRDWKAVEKLLAEAPETQQRSIDWRLLCSEVQVAQGKEKGGADELEAAIRAEPKEVSYRLALAGLALRKNDAAKAAEILDGARKVAGDRVKIRLARANLAVRMPKAEATAELKKLAKDSERFPARERTRLLEGLYRLSAAVDIKLARQFGSQLTDLEPARIDLRFGLLRLALADKDEPAARAMVAKLRELEGDAGPYWRCGDVAVNLQFKPADDNSWMDDARQRAGDAARARPDWSLPVLLLAELDEREGRIDSALVNFRSAIELGERSPAVVRHAVQLLQSRRRFEEAQELLRKLASQWSLDAELAKLALPASIGRETPEQILARARDAMPESSRDYRDHLWLGHLLSALGKNPAEAEKAYRRAVELAPQAGEAWVGLVFFLASSNQKAQAAKALAEAEQKLISPDSMTALALCLEALGEIETAEKRLLDASAKQPDNSTIQKGLAALYLHAGKLKQAEPILEKLSHGASSEADWARRQQAMILVQTGTYARIREAIPLIEQNLNSSHPTPEDERAKAILLALQPFRRAEAIRALAASFKLLPSTADEKILLAKLQEAAGNWPAARELLLTAVSGAPAVRHLIYFINRLLVHNDLVAAAQCTERLEKIDLDSLSTAAVKARVLVHLGKRDEANALLRTFMLAASNPEQLIVIGRLMEENELLDSAEQAYRRYSLRLKPKFGASADLPLARSFAMRGRIDDALRIAEAAGGDCRPDAVYSVASAILQSPKLDKAQSNRLENWIKTVQKKSPHAASLNLALAGVFEQRLRPVEALAYYDRALNSEPNNISALNNSAMLLALTKNGKDALPRIERAIDMVGPLPPLLDTRAMAQLVVGNSAAAIADLQEAIAQEESAVRRFHLALAHKVAGNEEEFGKNIKRAKNLKLTETMLNPFERNRWRETE